jgi:hypothetical protein
MPSPPTTIYSLTAFHGDDLSKDDVVVLDAIRRALLAAMGHSFIADFQTYSTADATTWSYQEGSEDGASPQGFIDTLEAICPSGWSYSTSVQTVRPGRRSRCRGTSRR